MQLIYRTFIFCLFLLLPWSISGQGTGNSPFSQFGVGDISNYQGNVRNMGMGFTGVASRHHFFVNMANPALLPNLRSRRKARLNHTYKYNDFFRNLAVDSTVKLDFAVNYQQRSIQSNTAYQSSGGMNISYLAFALPISKTWATAIGIQPFSIVNYNLVYSSTIGSSPTYVADNTVRGRGGIYKFFWSHGIGLTENLSVGLESSVLFGSVNTETTTTVPDFFNYYDYGFKRQTSYTSIGLKPGIAFHREIVKAYKDTVYLPDSTGALTVKSLVKKTKSSGVFYNIGLTYDGYTSLGIQQNLDLYVIANTNIIKTDTLLESKKYKAQLPGAFRFGFSLESPMKWSAAADVFYSNWSNFSQGFSTDTMKASYGFSIGGEYTPGKVKQRSKTFRAGISYVKTPYVYQGTQIDDMSFSIGASIPFGKRRRDELDKFYMPVFPRINVAIVAGQRGNVADVLVREQYIKASMSILIQQKWFNKRKIY